MNATGGCRRARSGEDRRFESASGYSPRSAGSQGLPMDALEIRCALCVSGIVWISNLCELGAAFAASRENPVLIRNIAHQDRHDMMHRDLIQATVSSDSEGEGISMATKLLFRDDAYLKTATATVVAVSERGIE